MLYQIQDYCLKRRDHSEDICLWILLWFVQENCESERVKEGIKFVFNISSDFHGRLSDINA